MTTKECFSQYVANTYARFPVELVSGKGELLRDADGRDYIDMGAGIAVNTFGMADKEWADAVSAQLHALQHTSNLYYNEPCGRLAEALCTRTGMKKVFFSNSGAEANECAIKTARKYAAKTKGGDYYTIITLKNSFHGRTLATLAATGQDTFHHDFLPLTQGFVYAEANDLSSVVSLARQHKCAAVMIEMIQGEGGVNVLTPEFVEGVARLCEEEDLLLIVDEVQTGNGRTGKLYAYMHYDITPDLVTTAKGLGGGLPIGAVLFGEKTKDTLKPGDHGSTFGGNPAVCAGALNILSRLTPDFLDEVEKKGEAVRKALQGVKGVRSITGMGLMLGIETDGDAGEIVSLAIERGILPLKAKNKIRLLPPLNISWENLNKAISILSAVIEEKSSCNG